MTLSPPHRHHVPMRQETPTRPRPAVTPTRLDLDHRPILVFWESTRACNLACRHCRASAIPHPVPGELTHEQGLRFIETLTGFGKPRPVLVITGGDVLMRADLDELIRTARGLDIPVAVSPSVTPLLTGARAADLRALGVKVASISLDGAGPATHEGIRQVEGHFADTLRAISLLREQGFTVQVNTVVMRENAEELAAIAEIVKESGAGIWEAFFLVKTGRGTGMEELSPAENEDVCNFLYDASRYGFIVRTVEGPFFRRVVAWRQDEPPGADVAARYGLGGLYELLARELRERLGEPLSTPRAQTKGTRDGKGIVFVAHDGEVYPAGFLPLSLGNVRRESLVEIYRESPLLRDIRAARFSGRCGSCEYADLCGGSRARAYAASGDPLGEDPACAYVPARSAPSTALQSR